MSIGLSIFLIVVGLILAFGVEGDVSGLDLDVIGLIIAAAGVAGIVLDFTIWGPRRRARVVDGPPLPPRPGSDGVVVEEHRVYDDGNPI